jgi:hypothetical protein
VPQLDVREDMEMQDDGIRVPRFFADSAPSLMLGLCARVLPSLRRVSGLGWVLAFRRVCVESLARVVCWVTAESLMVIRRATLLVA